MAEQNQSGSQQGGQGGADAGAIPPNAQTKFESTKTHVRAAADDLRSAATTIAEDYRGRAEDAWEQARDRVRTFQEDGEEYIRGNPTKAVFTALGIGFVLGLIFRR
ncbi:MAG: YqjD family protein [Chthoniobacterales bacterium]|jgi:ElaB/YqjD/DUF883 family membrane-anchored ribosome-binding protein